MRRVSLLLASALVVSLLPFGTVTAATAATAPTIAGEHDMRVATAKGTAAQLLTEIPAVPPLRVGYKPGLFPSLASTTKDKRGCTLRNQMLIKLAVKRPRVAKGCRLIGGAWIVDFGTKALTKASQVKLGKLVPDVYAYGQGASQWTQTQRDAFSTVIAPVRAATPSDLRMRPSMTMNLYLTISSSLITPLTSSAQRFVTAMNALLARSGDPTQAELAALASQYPQYYKGWSLATILNAKAWGLSMSPSLTNNFTLELSTCKAPRSKPVVQPMPDTNSLAYLVEQASNVNICTTAFVVSETGQAFQIKAVPQTASTVVADDPLILSEYGSPTGDVITRQMFGIHAPADWVSNAETGYNGPIDGATIPNVPVGFLRLWDTETTWKDLEPAKGTFDWHKLDKQIEMAQTLDANVMLVLGQTPGWAGNGSPQSNPTSLDDWRTYVRTVCQHYGGSISAYEVWNEANLQTFWTGTPAQMADLTKAAFEEIRGCNPGAQVVAANTTSRATGSFGTFFPAYLNELKARNWPVDAYSVHSYPTASGGADARINGIGQFRAALALAGAPVTRTYDTEINYGLEGLGEGHVTLTGDNAMTLMSRTYIDSARYGFGSTFWFVWTKAPDSKFGIQFTAQASAERQAWNTTYEWLVGSRFQRCLNASSEVTVCQFSKGAENFSIVWHGDVGSAPVTTSAGYFTGLGSRVCDLKGACTALTNQLTVPVGPMPLRIDGAPLPAGSTTAPTPGTDGYNVSLSTPQIDSVDVVYGVSNKVDATAAWSMSASADNPLPASTAYMYDWSFCQGGQCKSVSSGTTAPNTYRVTATLTEGPGTYKFSVRAFARIAEVGNPASAEATTEFKVLTTRAAPPSGINWWITNGDFRANWLAPNIRAGLIKGYEVQFRNETTKGDWVTLDTSASGNSLRIKARSVPITSGQTGVVRVRTILKSGATSAYIASDPWTVATQLEPPLFASAWQESDQMVARALAPAGVLSEFPLFAWQLHYSTDGGATWKFVQVNSINGKAPTVERSLMAFSSQNTISDIPAGALVQARTITTDGRLPSEWINLHG